VSSRGRIRLFPYELFDNMGGQCFGSGSAWIRKRFASCIRVQMYTSLFGEPKPRIFLKQIITRIDTERRIWHNFLNMSGTQGVVLTVYDLYFQKILYIFQRSGFVSGSSKSLPFCLDPDQQKTVRIRNMEGGGLSKFNTNNKKPLVNN
jgi:hypothetical protein